MRTLWPKLVQGVEVMSGKSDLVSVRSSDGSGISVLTMVDDAKQALAVASSFEEVKDIRDSAEAMRVFAKSIAAGQKAQNHCAEIKIRAERRMGEVLAKLDKNVGAKGSGSNQHEVRSHDVTAPTLADINITKMQSSRWQAIAAVPEFDFIDHIAKATAAGNELTSAGVIRLGRRLKAASKKADERPNQRAARKSVSGGSYRSPSKEELDLFRQANPDHDWARDAEQLLAVVLDEQGVDGVLAVLRRLLPGQLTNAAPPTSQAKSEKPKSADAIMPEIPGFLRELALAKAEADVPTPGDDVVGDEARRSTQ
jgi:hypothetical protein